jgi:hypothetical protein
MSSPRHHWLLITFALVAIVGCIPEKRIVWSPDGQHAAVCAHNGLYIVDADGKVLPHRLDGQSLRCAWFPDGARLAVALAVKCADWDKLARDLDKQTVIKVENAADAVRERILAYDGKWDDFRVDPDDTLSPGEESAVLLYIIHQRANGLADKFGDRWDEIKRIDANLYRLMVVEVTKDKLVSGKILHTGLDEITQPKVASTGKLVAFIRVDANPKDAPPSLYVASVDGGSTRHVASFVSYDYDWSADGRGLALIRANATDFKENAGIVLGSLTTVHVADEKDVLFAQPAELKDRVGLLFNMLSGVRWLADERILFAAVEVTLPATTRDMPQRWTLFSLDLRAPACASRVIGRDFNEPIDTGHLLFEVSPDRTRVVLPGVNGRWILHDLRDGSSKLVVDEKDIDGKSPFLPSWRNNDELCVPGLEQKRPDGTKYTEALLWTNGKTRSLSAGWPVELTDGWLTGNR